jgi:hypothetical protein
MKPRRSGSGALLLSALLAVLSPMAQAQTGPALTSAPPGPARDSADPLRALLGPAPNGLDPLQALFGHVRDAVRDHVDDVKASAWQTYQTAPRSGTCAERRAEIDAVLLDAVQLAQWDRDIYADGYDDEMAASGARVMDIEPRRRAYRESVGRRYAEVRADPAGKRVVVVFRGTRIEVGSDILTDIASHIGLETAYYAWAADLVARVVRDHPGFEVVITGHSLGGGLALYAGLRNPGTHVMVFNAAGLSLATWAKTNAADRARINADAVVIVTRNNAEIEPVSALSFAGRSVLPGRIAVIETDVADARALHGPAVVAHAVKQLAATSAGDKACDGNIAVLAR